jgi:hypothetical protein
MQHNLPTRNFTPSNRQLLVVSLSSRQIQVHSSTPTPRMNFDPNELAPSFELVSSMD